MSPGRHALACLLLSLLGACASPAPPEVPELEGRLTLQVQAHEGMPARSLATAFVLRGSATAGSLQLTTPLGTIAALARWDASAAAELTTETGTRRFANLDALALELLGEPMPLAAAIDWLHGRPWPGAAAQATSDGFAQLGWQVDVARLAEGWVLARRERAPEVTLRARLDRAK